MNRIIKFLIFVMCFSLVNGALALDVDIPEDLEDDRNLPREERIRRHQKRVQLILEARKKSKEEERQRLLEEARAKAQKASAAKKKTTPSRPPAAPPGKPGDAPSDALSFTPLSSKTLAQTILYFTLLINPLFWAKISSRTWNSLTLI